MESFFSTLGFEPLDGKGFIDREHSWPAIVDRIHGCCNPQRRNWNIGNSRSVQLELAWQIRRRGS